MIGLDKLKVKLYTVLSFESLGKYYKNASWLFLEKVMRIFSGLFIGVWLARYLGPEQFGTYSYVQSFVSMVAVMASLGLDRIIVKELVDKKFNQNDILGTALLMKFGAAILVLVILFFSPIFITNTESEQHLIIVLGLGFSFVAFNVIDFYFQSLVLSRYIVIVNLISLFITSILSILMLITKQPLEYFVYLLLFNTALLYLLMIIIYQKKAGGILNWKFNFPLMRKLFKQGWPLIFTSALVILQMKIDQVMLRQMIDVSSVGQYAAAVKLSEASYFLPMVILSSLWPAIVKLRAKGEKIYLEKLQKLYNLMSFLALSLALVISVFAGFIVSVMFGDGYHEAVTILQIHVWAAVFVYLGVVSGAYLVNEGLTKKNLYRAALGLVTNVGLNYILIPIYSGQGAAIATLVSFMVTNYFYDLIDGDLRVQFMMKSKSLFPIYLLRIGKDKASDLN